MNSMKSRYSHLVIEGSSLTVNKWQSQDQTEIPNPRSLLLILSRRASRPPASGNKEAQSRSVRSSCTVHRRAGGIFGIFQHKDRLAKKTQGRNVGMELAGRKLQSFQCSEGSFPAGDRYGGSCVALQPPLQQRFRMQPLGRAEREEPKPKPKHNRVIHATCMVHYLGISLDKTQDSSVHYVFSKENNQEFNLSTKWGADVYS